MEWIGGQDSRRLRQALARRTAPLAVNDLPLGDSWDASEPPVRDRNLGIRKQHGFEERRRDEVAGRKGSKR